MNAPITVTATLAAWATSQHNVERILDYLAKGDQRGAADAMCFSDIDTPMDQGSNPWTRMGEAQVTITVHSRDALVANQLRSLQAELDAARAQWLTTQKQILERIGKLQAITNEVEA